eukprot:TRINITY_DN11407_c0_g1_i1.p1 TRINITY_DN11407_c0_g1~~TRINITY_DN11407_c0_g1_i1.p1  ORF type:complete len:503 (-),score=134.04 TRINITY_DN11407_c0_g1_i1:97-1605(-)
MCIRDRIEFMEKFKIDEAGMMFSYPSLCKHFSDQLLGTLKKDFSYLRDLRLDRISDEVRKANAPIFLKNYAGIMDLKTKANADDLDFVTDNLRYYADMDYVESLKFDLTTIKTAHDKFSYQVVKVDEGLIATNGADNKVCLTNYMTGNSKVITENCVSSCICRVGDYTMSGNNSHMLIWKYNKQAETLEYFHKAEFPDRGFVRSVDPVHLTNTETHVIVGFNGGSLMAYCIDSKEIVCETKVTYSSPRIDVFYNNIITDVIHFSSAWFDQPYFTVHTFNSTRKEFKEVVKYDEQFKVQRVRSVIIHKKRCVVYGGNGNVGIYNVDDKSPMVKHTVQGLGSCSALSLIGYNTTDFLILFYNKAELHFYSYTANTGDKGELKLVDKCVDATKLSGNYTNSCCMWITDVSAGGAEIILAKHDDQNYNAFTRLNVKFNPKQQENFVFWPYIHVSRMHDMQIQRLTTQYHQRVCLSDAANNVIPGLMGQQIYLMWHFLFSRNFKSPP